MSAISETYKRGHNILEVADFAKYCIDSRVAKRRKDLRKSQKSIKL